MARITARLTPALIMDMRIQPSLQTTPLRSKVLRSLRRLNSALRLPYRRIPRPVSIATTAAAVTPAIAPAAQQRSHLHPGRVCGWTLMSVC